MKMNVKKTKSLPKAVTTVTKSGNAKAEPLLASSQGCSVETNAGNVTQKNTSLPSLEAKQYPQRWKPGQSGNPKGRPRDEFSITTQIKKKLKEPIDITVKGKRYRAKAIDVFAERFVEILIKSMNPQLVKELFQRVDGSIKEDKAPASAPISYIQIIHSNGSTDTSSPPVASSGEGQAESKEEKGIYKIVPENISEKNDEVKLLKSGVRQGD